MILNELLNTFQNNKEKNALCIDDTYYTYEDLLQRVNGLRLEINKSVSQLETNVGLLVENKLDTYASIFALWLEGKAYVPLLPYAPIERNKQVVEESQIATILCTNDEVVSSLNVKTIKCGSVDSSSEVVGPRYEDVNRLAYILFTSGSTGTPKGVQITLGNLDAFIHAMVAAGHALTPDDRVLQMFELTFDFSVVSYLLPLYSGACIYTVPSNEVKYSYVLDLLEEYSLTVLFLVPSIITLLKFYFDDINQPQVRLCSFCGEALYVDITNEWQKCIPNARIINFYGPTEDTVFCTYYDFNESNQKNHNGAIAIGKAMLDGDTIIVDEQLNELPCGEKGELCLAGPQLTPGYWKNKEKNEEAFFMRDGKRFYRTGDLCFFDEEGDLQYVGRIDFQVKIQGFRIELSEIEHFANEAFQGIHTCICVAFINKIHTTEIGLIIESNGKQVDTEKALEYLKSHLPNYEVPTSVKVIDKLPLNNNGKIDRKVLINSFENA